MDQNPRRMPSEGLTSSPSLSTQSLYNQRQNQEEQQPSGCQMRIPEDIDSALRFTPLTSIVPVSASKTLEFTINADRFPVLNVLPSLNFTCLYPTKLSLNPEEQRRTDEYFDVFNQNAQNPAEQSFQKGEFRNTVNLLNQIDDRTL